ncbi:MAG TPA: hypothetical protein VLA90_05795, partial [Actinomycetota bacterium]|nr:hypothetical protein [Actinomycetota bacterium]
MKELAEWTHGLPPENKSRLGRFLHAMAWFEGGKDYQPTDEQRAAGCGYCNGQASYYSATMCLEHAWQYV